jgi:hypothetical protein
MSLDIKHHPVRLCGLAAISAVATMLVAAVADPGGNWTRLRALPSDQRQKLSESLKKFDLLYTPAQQESIRDLDRRLNELDPAKRSEYFAVLRRYHNWLNRLPEKRQTELTDAPASERLAMVKKLLDDYPVPRTKTGQLLQIMDVGDYSPFELAALFKIWQGLKPEQQSQIARIAAIAKRHAAMFELGAEQKIAAEIRPPEFDEKRWAGEFESFARAKRPLLLLADVKKKQEPMRGEILRRQAINYYFLKNRPHAVNPDRLADFLAAFPPWLQSAFDPYPFDEVRRRLTIVYRLVFPFPAEIQASPQPAAPQAVGRPGPSSGRGAPGPKGKGQARPGGSPF